MIAYIICANDSIEKVVLDDEAKALREMDILSKKDFKRVSWNYKSYEAYKHIIYWRLYEVEVLK